ncbi:uncharacterized protein [Nicotiana sylvestris]|uniref:uncharacterized protein n=1 Tax=Nicotiana sylvestris TaxID=4096 RepID=UPI00388CEBDA
METTDMGTTHEGEDIFCGCLAGVDDVSDLDATIIFYEALRLLNQVVMLHREAFTKSQAELNQCESDLKRLMEERDTLKRLCVQKEEEIRDLRAELVQQKVEKIEQLREEAETLRWKQNMDRLASEKDTARAQLSSIEHQLQSIIEESLARAKKIEELETRLAAEFAKATSVAEKAKADTEAVMVVYRSDAEAANA